ncbi:hypothetical protein BKA70DRAFT_387249 [Coprinopsis sp. MPI-PUGE-AT-0042]|nr:hypothetical protein BKA70DRAFT_387249 [Coprinopsis sp. MPI-PUGE-AT-0042]
MGYIFQDDTQDEPTTWYLRQADYIESSLDQNYNYHICSTLDCSTYWVPTRFNVEPPGEEDNTITLRQRPLAGNGFELWRIRPVLGIDVAPTSSFSEEEEEEISSSSATSSASFTTVSAPATTSVEQRPPQSSATGDHGQQSNTLKKCAPCGSTECSFTPSGEPQKATYSVLIGQPVYNCDNGSAETTTAKFGGTYQLQNSWSVEVSVTAGFGFMGPSISSTVTGTTGGTKVVIQTQEIEVGIRPGQIGALVANISYITQPGQVNVDDSTLAFVSVQPEFVVGYSVRYTDCSSNFQALTLPKVECDSGAGKWHGPLLDTQMVLLWTLLVTMRAIMT